MDITSYMLGIKKGAGSASALKYLVVEELPEIGENNTIYLVPKSTSKTNNYYDEYMYINSAWELIGDTEVDLSDYLKEEDLKTINGNSIVGSGDLQVGKKTIIFTVSTNNWLSDWTNYDTVENRQNLQILKDNYENIDDYTIILDIINGSSHQYVYCSKYSNYYNYPRLIFIYNTEATNTQYGNTYHRVFKIILNKVTRVDLDNIQLTTKEFDFFENNKILFADNTSVFTPTGDYNPATKKYVDDNIQITQYETLPTASADNIGKIAQYIGTTDSNYTNGYFYQVVSDGQDPATYSWENIQVQAGGGSSAPEYMEDGDGNKLYLMKTPFNNNIVNPIAFSIRNDILNGKLPVVLLIDKNNFSTMVEYDTNYTNIFFVNNINNINENTTQIQLYSKLTDAKKVKGNYGEVIMTKKNRLNLFFSNNFTSVSVSLTSDTYSISSAYLPSNNTITFTPTGDYNPSTKLYTDKTHYENMTGYDATKTQVLKNVQGVLTWITEE